jgi:hypothetical protein
MICSSGGETPINNSTLLYRRLKDDHPDFIDNLQEKVTMLQS